MTRWLVLHSIASDPVRDSRYDVLAIVDSGNDPGGDVDPWEAVRAARYDMPQRQLDWIIETRAVRVEDMEVIT